MSEQDLEVNDSPETQGQVESSLPQGGDAVDYDWSVPNFFTTTQLEKIEQLAALIESNMSKAVSDKLNQEIELRAGSPTQLFGSNLGTSTEEGGYYYAGLIGHQGEVCGLISLPAKCALGWVAKALGSGGGDDQEPREPSAMEAMLLLDILAGATTAISDALSLSGGPEIQCGQQIHSEPLDADVDPGNEYMEILFKSTEPESEAALRLTLTCGVFMQALGMMKREASSKEDVRKEMLGHIEQIQITAEVTIGTVEIAMHDITGMQPGEIVLIGTEAGQQVDLVAEGRPVLSGYMISSKGWYGLKVIDDSDTNN